MPTVIGASTGWWIGLVLGIVVIAVAAAIVITIVLLARRIAGQARGAVEGRSSYTNFSPEADSTFYGGCGALNGGGC